MQAPPPPPGFYSCPLCVVQVQRMPNGTLQDGLNAHYKTVHPRQVAPRIARLPPSRGSAS